MTVSDYAKYYEVEHYKILLDWHGEQYDEWPDMEKDWIREWEHDTGQDWEEWNAHREMCHEKLNASESYDPADDFCQQLCRETSPSDTASTAKEECHNVCRELTQNGSRPTTMEFCYQLYNELPINGTEPATGDPCPGLCNETSINGTGPAGGGPCNQTCNETKPAHNKKCDPRLDSWLHNETSYGLNKFLAPPNPILLELDEISMAYFAFELTLRFAFCPNKRGFFASVLNIFDFLSIVPYLCEMTVLRYDVKEQYEQSFVDALLVLKVFRIFRVFRLARQNKGLRVLVFTIIASRQELMLLIIFLCIAMVLFATLVYYADFGETTFRSIPHAFWWAIVTMTTLGYGDFVPKSGKGYFVGSLCAVTGVLVLAFTVPGIVNNFLLLYRDVQYEKKQDKAKPEACSPCKDAKSAGAGCSSSRQCI